MIHLELSYSHARADSGWGGVMLDQKLQVSVFLWTSKPEFESLHHRCPNSITSFCINFLVLIHQNLSLGIIATAQSLN